MKIKNKINCLVVFVATAIFWQPSYVMADQLNISIEKMNELGVNQNTPKKTITGLLTESSGDPIIGATVSVKGTSRGVMTDIDGRYSIEASDGEEIVFQLIGFNTETIAVKKDVNVINLRMEASQIELDEVVVVGFGQQKKESVVASLTSIGSKELSVSSRSLTNNIAGKISGVIAVQRSGEPGWDDAQFWIRGVSSYAGGTDPLVLVDGVPRKMNDIDVDEIETFTVLKDASATAVYGAEGANGVILITSKRGKSQKTRINVKLEHGIATPMRLPKLLNSYQYLSLFNEATWNDAGNPLVGFVAPTSDDVLEKYRLGIDPDLYPNANWMDMLRNNTQNQRYTINFRGGGEKVRFFVSGAYYQEDAIYEKNRTDAFDSNAKFERYNLRSNIDFDVTKTTRMSIDMSGQYVNRVAPSQTSDNIFNGMTLFPVHLIPTIYSDGTASEHPESDNQGLRQNPFNFLYFSGYSKSWTSTVQTKVSIDQDLDVLTEGLSIKGALSFDAYSEQYVNRTMSPKSYYVTGRNPDGSFIRTLRNAGSALGNPSSGASGGEKKIYIETSLNYKKTFDEKHDVVGVLVYNQKETQKQNVGGLNLLPYRKQNIVGRASYGYDNRYMLEGSFGMTGSENFASGHRWGIFPAIGGAWYVTHESFMQNTIDVLSKLKVRASYGKTGNDDLEYLGRFPYQATLNQNAGGYNLGISGISNGTNQNGMGGGISESNAAAPYLQWEIEDKTNFGIDLGLFRGRVDISADYFSNRRHDILERRKTIPTMSGLRNGPLQNISVVTNKGFDGNIVVKQDISQVNFTFRGNFTYTKNKIINNDEIPHVLHYQNLTGHSIGTPYLYVADGLYTPDDFNISYDPATGQQTYKLKDGMPNPGSAVSPGDIKYADLNNDGKIDGNDQTYNHNKNPKDPRMVYGLAVDAEYKGFFVGIFFQGSAGASVNLMAKAENFMPFKNGKDASSARQEALSRWTASDPYNQDVLYPRMHGSDFSYNTRPSTWWYRDASFIRLKNIEFGYQFNKNQLSKIGMNNLRVYVQGTNLITWDHVKYWDPELGDARSGAKYPLSRSWTAGLEVTF